MMKRFAAVALAASLTACLPHPPPPPPPYRAVAQAPADWTLVIDDRYLSFFPATGQQPLLQPVPRPISGVAGQTYQTPRITVNIVHNQPCTDGRTSLAYPHTVQVTIDGRLHNGCGGL